ncbi:MAG: CBS and ACT domain-containing protein [Spirochaetota bacterium]|nr:CBS and ACT domain-containing protein [Spirochaetota bacterium]
MYLKDIMTMNVVTIPSKTSLADAKRIMKAHKIQRLPVVDKGKLVGMVTEHSLESVSPSKATSLSVWEIGYLLEKTSVSSIMNKQVVSATPDMTVEEGLAHAQNNKVGSLPVLEDGKVVGIITTNDFFYKIVNKVLGIGESGNRIEVIEGGEGKALEEVIACVNKHNLKILTIHMIAPDESEKKDVVVHVDTDNVEDVVDELKAKGYTVSVRSR